MQVLQQNELQFYQWSGKKSWKKEQDNKLFIRREPKILYFNKYLSLYYNSANINLCKTIYYNCFVNLNCIGSQFIFH